MKKKNTNQNNQQPPPAQQQQQPQLQQQPSQPYGQQPSQPFGQQPSQPYGQQPYNQPYSQGYGPYEQEGSTETGFLGKWVNYKQTADRPNGHRQPTKSLNTFVHQVNKNKLLFSFKFIFLLHTSKIKGLYSSLNSKKCFKIGYIYIIIINIFPYFCPHFS